MTLATQTLEVIGLRRRDADTVTVELGALQTGGGPNEPVMPMPLTSHMIQVPDADAPVLGALVTLTFALQA